MYKDQTSYQKLRNIVSERTSPLVAWVGAGLSSPANLPTWIGLKDCLLEELEKQIQIADTEDKEKKQAQYSLAKLDDNLWKSFTILYEALGNTTYKTKVREVFSVINKTPPPTAYSKMWQLKLSGMISLNIDQYAQRSFQELYQGKRKLPEFPGNKAGDYTHLLSSPSPFAANMHGILDDYSSWVFTFRQLSKLIENEGYKNFITSCATTRTIIFAGISADDLAAGGHLEKLSKLNIDFGNHFWITPRSDSTTRQWAENAGIHIINYESKNDDHSQFEELLTDLAKYSSQDKSPEIITPTIKLEKTDDHIPDAESLEKLPAENIRNVLNHEAIKLISSDTSESNIKYSAFCNEYDIAIFRAWDVALKPKRNKLFRHTLTDSQEGSFGSVYRANSPSGSVLAIKVLRPDLRDHPNMLQAFRRGVKSMQILTDANIEGIVPFISAAEIPACVFMEYIDGPNLKDAVDSKQLYNWEDILHVSVELSEIINRAHKLPQRVLHRDIRPTNIMLKDYYTSPQSWKVVVLDFDLSWHKGAWDGSVNKPTSMNGFLAPEQFEDTGDGSTRSALVDSFGLGMTLFYLRSSKEPHFSQQKHSDWRDVLTDEISFHKHRKWKSLPRRFARTIEWATRNKQSERWDPSQILNELKRLQIASVSPSSVLSAELIAEELAARSSMYSEYEWDRDLFKASYSPPTGIEISLTGDESEMEVVFDLKWQEHGKNGGQNIGKYIQAKCEKALSLLKRSGWNAQIVSNRKSNTHIQASYSTLAVRHKLDKAAKAVSDAYDAFSTK